MCERGQWVCHEKHLMEAAGLGRLSALFREIPSERQGLLQWVDRVAEGLGVPRDEAMPWMRGAL